jgi:hypothetical protein
MGENMPYTSYLSQKELSFIEKCNFCKDFKLLKNNTPLQKILARTLQEITPYIVANYRSRTQL